jgi:hypothetical protein
MITKDRAIEIYCLITSGKIHDDSCESRIVDRYKHLDVIQRGGVAESLWDDGAFTLGIEYGVLMALVELFEIRREDIIVRGDT